MRASSGAKIQEAAGLDALVDDFEATTDDHRLAERARFAASIIITAAATTLVLASEYAGIG